MNKPLPRRYPFQELESLVLKRKHEFPLQKCRRKPFPSTASKKGVKRMKKMM